MKHWIGFGVLGASFALATACGGDSEDGNFSEVKGGSPSTGGSSGSSSGSGGSSNAGRAGSSSAGTNSGMNEGGSSGSLGSGGAPDTGEGGASDGAGGPGKGGEGPGKGDGGAPSDGCPATAPGEMVECEGKLRCLYVGLRCDCMGAGDDKHFECKGSGNACPSTVPEDESDCENPQGEPALECPYPEGTQCRCMGDSWNCNELPGGPNPPGAGGAPDGPMPP